MSYELKIISLLDDIDKRNVISQRCKDFNLDFTFIDAYNGKNMEAGDYFKLSKNTNYSFGHRSFLTPSELGCFISHRMAIHDFINNSKNEWLIILEDDVYFDEKLTTFANVEINDLDKDNIYILGGQDGLPSFNRVIFSSKTIGNKLKFKTPILGTHRWIYRTCGYAINRKIAESLSFFMHKNTYIADDWRYVLKNTIINKLFYCDLINHPMDTLQSNIEEERKIANKL